jgi:phosphoribosyl-dephospho-CoA transferase
MNDEIYSLLKNMGVDQQDIDYLRKNIKRTGDVEKWLRNHKSPELSATLAAVGAAYLRNK